MCVSVTYSENLCRVQDLEGRLREAEERLHRSHPEMAAKQRELEVGSSVEHDCVGVNAFFHVLYTQDMARTLRERDEEVCGGGVDPSMDVWIYECMGVWGMGWVSNIRMHC